MLMSFFVYGNSWEIYVCPLLQMIEFCTGSCLVLFSFISLFFFLLGTIKNVLFNHQHESPLVLWGSINLWFFILKISLHLHHFISCALIIYSIWSVELISNISNCKWVCFFWLKTTNEFGINCNFDFIAKLRYTNRMAQVSDCCALIVGSITVYELSSILLLVGFESEQLWTTSCMTLGWRNVIVCN